MDRDLPSFSKDSDCASRIASIDRLLSEQRAKLSAMGFLEESSSALEIPKSLLPTLGQNSSSVPKPVLSQSTIEFSTGSEEVVTEEVRSVKSNIFSLKEPKTNSVKEFPGLSLTAEDVLSKVRNIPVGKLLRKASETSKDEAKSLSSKKTMHGSFKIPVKGQQRQTVEKAVKTLDRRSRRSSEHLPYISPDDPLSYIDVTAKTLGSDAAVHILKAKVRKQTTDFEHAQEQITKSAQQLVKKTKEQEELENEYRELKIRQTQHETKLKAATHETLSAKKQVRLLTSDLEKLRKEVSERKRKSAEGKKQEVSVVSLNRLTVVQEKLNKELKELRETNKVLTDMKEKQSKEMANETKRHRKQLEKCVKVIQKQEELIGVLDAQRHLLEEKQLLAFAEQEFQSNLKTE